MDEQEEKLVSKADGVGDKDKPLKEHFSSFRFRKRILAVADAFIVFLAGVVTQFLLHIFDIYLLEAEFLLSLLVVSVLGSFSGLMLFGCYNKLWRYFNWSDYLSCVKGVVFGFAVLCLIFVPQFGLYGTRYIAFHCLISILGVCSFRFIFKGTFVTLVATGRSEADKKRTLIVGAGRCCRMMLWEIFDMASKDKLASGSQFSGFIPVCIVDDDRSKIGTRIRGVEVLGSTNDIVKLVEIQKIEQIVFAIPSAPPGDRRKILEICSRTGLPVKTIPFFGETVENANLLKEIRDINVEDLLGREPVRFNNKDVRAFVEGKVCMVSGGGGSIGSELVRQIAKYSPKQIIIVDIYENNAYEIQQELLMEYGSELNLVTLIASVRDYSRMNQIFKQFHPEVVFHAAAHKHVPLMEFSPMEAIKNNVMGTFNIASISLLYNVKKFVMISTDKAVNPTNVMGASKRCCEMIVQFLSQQKDSKTEFVTTRFGNVLGSNGSVIPLFKRQIEQGRPVTVTHPDIIRYFMTIPEAVSLVMEAASIAHGGEIFVLDMGQPVKIVTLAENLIRMYGKVPYKDVEIKFTGLRPGEKIKEELLMNEEGLQKTQNKLIFIGKQIEIDTATFTEELWKLKCAADENDDEVAINALRKIVPTFTTPELFNKTVLMKGKEPVYDEIDRARIAAALKCVDEVHIVNTEITNDKMKALEKFHFDVLFSGDDWKGSERYKKTRLNLPL